MEGVTDLEILRIVLARELETINEYTALARQAQEPAVRDLLLHISRDEEEHVAECIQWISRLNPVMADFLSRPIDHVKGGGPAQVSLPAPPVNVPPAASTALAPQPDVPPVSPAVPLIIGMAAPGGGQLLTRVGLTVGNLLNRPVGQE